MGFSAQNPRGTNEPLPFFRVLCTLVVPVHDIEDELEG